MTHAPAARKRPGPGAGEDDDGDSDADSTVPPPDGGWGWIVVWASFMIHIVTDGVTYSFGVMLQKLTDYFGAGEGATSFIMSTLVGVTLCSGPIASAFVNKWGCRTVTIAGAIMSGFFLAVSFFAPNVATLYVTIGLGTGFGFGLIYLPAIVSVTCYFEKYRSLATGIAVAGSGLGTFIFAPFIEYLVSEYGGWRPAVLILAGLVLNTAIMGALFRPLEKAPASARRRAVELKGDKSELKLLLNGDLTKEQQAHHLMPPPSQTQTVVRSAHSIPTAVQDSAASGNHTVPRNVKVLSLNLSANPHQILSSGHNHHNHHHQHHHHNQHSWRHKSDIARLALSQPTLQTTTGGSVQHLAGSGVMYRKDVFYRGSLLHIPHYSPDSASPTASAASTARASSLVYRSRSARSGGGGRSPRGSDGPFSAPQSPRWTRYSSRPPSDHSDLVDGLGAAVLALSEAAQGIDEGMEAALIRATSRSASRLSRHTSTEALGGGHAKGLPAEAQSPDSDSDAQLTVCGCIPCSPETKDTLSEMLDMSLFRDIIFMLFTISNFLTSVGFYMPYAYISAYGEKTVGLSKLESSLLVSVIGIANLIGRLVLGYVSDKPWVNRLLVYNLSLTIAGVGTVLVVVCNDFWSLAIYASVFGFTIGAYVGLTSVILVDLLGLDKLTNAFGLLLLFQGLASFVGPPIGGILYDVTLSYKPSFWVAGVNMAVSGLMLFVIPPIQRRIEARKQKECKRVVSSPAISNGNARPQPV
ncbi:hypothetical protein ONE63_010720 [Megalurothrips usitatus]|uniref:Major facilitator superfamily (MFS) profile domain-containing protein n=1 Tax=Megalurothrips usitatus TaxID=439358 RepID=A0AAV7XKQ8_9NEOP|nr:hypothetical protein ONE63_010720 [Megalurothrips usitatus]